ncbi:hypothetical protein M8818_006392 [Zalaria obscura]|uniref:Uncharacterized protein n=1 Tax=Zalaria obscura TaxID=2024903 RepID=A0ACC3S637_9PEZI
MGRVIHAVFILGLEARVLHFLACVYEVDEDKTLLSERSGHTGVRQGFHVRIAVSGGFEFRECHLVGRFGCWISRILKPDLNSSRSQ